MAYTECHYYYARCSSNTYARLDLRVDTLNSYQKKMGLVWRASKMLSKLVCLQLVFKNAKLSNAAVRQELSYIHVVAPVFVFPYKDNKEPNIARVSDLPRGKLGLRAEICNDYSPICRF